MAWFIDNLEAGSALATVRGRGEPDQVWQVVRAYADVGEALAQDRPLAYSRQMVAATDGFRKLLGPRIEAVRFETAEREAILRANEQPGDKRRAAVAASPAEPLRIPGAYGAVSGRVQTLSNRGGLRFTLYDLLHDRAVSCYLREGGREHHA